MNHDVVQIKNRVEQDSHDGVLPGPFRQRQKMIFQQEIERVGHAYVSILFYIFESKEVYSKEETSSYATRGFFQIANTL